MRTEDGPPGKKAGKSPERAQQQLRGTSKTQTQSGEVEETPEYSLEDLDDVISESEDEIAVVKWFISLPRKSRFLAH